MKKYLERIRKMKIKPLKDLLHVTPLKKEDYIKSVTASGLFIQSKMGAKEIETLGFGRVVALGEGTWPS